MIILQPTIGRGIPEDMENGIPEDPYMGKYCAGYDTQDLSVEPPFGLRMTEFITMTAELEILLRNDPEVFIFEP